MGKACAVFVCNADYLEKAAFAADQVLAHGADGFDVVICTDVIPSPRPAWMPDAVNLMRLDFDQSMESLPQNDRLKHYTYWRLPAIDALASDYDRILYLDTDVVVVRAGLSRIFDIDMQGAPLAAVLDVHQRHRPNRQLREFDAMGYSVAPYFNAGVLLIDGRAWKYGDTFNALMTLAQTRPDLLFCHDQSLLNVHFYQNWLELSPLWNWQNSNRVNMVGEALSPFLIHFVGATKPWDAPDGSLPVKYHVAFAAFQGADNVAHHIAPPIGKDLWKNIWYWRKTQTYLNRFADLDQGILHQTPKVPLQ